MNKIAEKSRKLFVLMTLLASSVCAEKAVANDCYTENVYCCEQNEGKFFLSGDVLYWRPYLSGLELDFGRGAIDQTTVDGTQVIVSDEFDIDPSFDWDAGYRVAAGYGMSNGFGLGAEYTHFKGKGHRSSFENGDITSHGKFNVKLDQVDLVLGYDYAFNCDFHVKPFFGVRGARIKDSVKGLITTQLTINDVPALGEIRNFNHRQDYRAIGPILGLYGDYNIGCGLGIYGSAAASLLYGRIHVNMDDETLLGTLVNSVIFTSNARHLHSFDPNADLAIGISWNTDFFECAKLSMKLGFEHHEYFNQNHFSVFRGDMSFTGGIFSLDIVL
jgi:hypothetical protein